RPFSTAFVRPDRFRFEFEDANGRRKKRCIVWADGADVRTWWDVRPGLRQESSLGLALAGATGASGRAARPAPGMLLPEVVGGRLLTDLTQLQRLEDAKLGEVDCFRVQGRSRIDVNPAAREQTRQVFRRVTGKEWVEPMSGPETLWIDRATFLLR